ncbi:MAG: T9SS type A sorting domain-containing protein [Bacteroidales bacterium]|nr:T9SS type A sorting domain-containing protein [Bacteroidales bacterium]
MKNRFFLYLSVIAIVIILGSAISNVSHSPGAKTGSPADGADCSACHTGSAQTAISWISSNIPVGGYAPGTKYTITLTGIHSGVAKFGFEITAEDATKAKKGVFTITNANETQLTNLAHAVTHTGNGLTPSNNTKSWSFDWTAPATGSGGVTFYASLNAADGNNATSGDVIYNTNYTYNEDLSIGMNSEGLANSFNIFPNPANNVLSIETSSIQYYDIKILDLTGKLIISDQFNGGLESVDINISDLPKGSYIIQIQNKDAQFSELFIKR